jgi:hypothetical protein
MAVCKTHLLSSKMKDALQSHIDCHNHNSKPLENFYIIFINGYCMMLSNPKQVKCQTWISIGLAEVAYKMAIDQLNNIKVGGYQFTVDTAFDTKEIRHVHNTCCIYGEIPECPVCFAVRNNNDELSADLIITRFVKITDFSANEVKTDALMSSCAECAKLRRDTLVEQIRTKKQQLTQLQKDVTNLSLELLAIDHPTDDT